MIKLAIGITTYNNETNFENIQKLYKEFDFVYIVDDNSKDNLCNLLTDNNITFEKTPHNIGAPGYSRNVILKKAIDDECDFITFCDGDDFFDFERLKALIEKIDISVDFVFTPMLTQINEYENVVRSNITSLQSGIYDQKFVSMYEKKISSIFNASGGRIYNLHTIAENKFKYEDDLPGQDSLFNTQFKVLTEKFQIENEYPFYKREIINDSLSSNTSYKSFAKRTIARKKMLDLESEIVDIKKKQQAWMRRTSRTTGLTYQQKKNIAQAIYNDTNEKTIEGLKFEYRSPVESNLQTVNKKYKDGITFITNCLWNVDDLNLPHQIININELELNETENLYVKILELIKYKSFVFIDSTMNLNQTGYWEYIVKQKNDNQSDILVTNIYNKLKKSYRLEVERPLIKEYFYDVNNMMYYGIVFDSKSAAETGINTSLQENEVYDLIIRMIESQKKVVFNQNKGLEISIYNKFISQDAASYLDANINRNLLTTRNCTNVFYSLVNRVNTFKLFSQFNKHFKILGFSNFPSSDLDYIKYTLQHLDDSFNGIIIKNNQGMVISIIKTDVGSSIDFEKYNTIKFNMSEGYDLTSLLNEYDILLRNHEICMED